MALDHARDHAFAGGFDPLLVGRTTAAVFFTRWVTHICAPLFVFLAGTSAFLYLSKGRTKTELSAYLIKRGAILLVFEIFYMSRWFTLSMDGILLQVLWVFGVSMIVLAGLVWLPERAIFAFGISMVLGHNLLDGVLLGPDSPFFIPWTLLHQGDRTILLSPTLSLRLLYPLIPWIGLMALGYLFGGVMLMEKDRRIKVILRLGFWMTAAFIVLRAANVYGNPHPWVLRDNSFQTLLDFINCEKYPPSLLFLLMTMGPGLVLLGLLEKGVPRFARPLRIFGGVPLFFYLIHIPVIIGLAAVFSFLLVGSSVEVAVFSPDLSLRWVYLAWLGCLALTYPVCRWYAVLKKEKNWGWMKYI